MDILKACGALDPDSKITWSYPTNSMQGDMDLRGPKAKRQVQRPEKVLAFFLESNQIHDVLISKIPARALIIFKYHRKRDSIIDRIRSILPRI